MPKKGIDQEAKKLFFKILTNLKAGDLGLFIGDIFSSAEVKDFSRRLLAAKLLMEKKTYLEICHDMGMSENTINKIHFKTKGSPLIRRLFEI
ncbi:MAG: Trp family transcriptional regulator [Patescibacteria group bacterium]